MSTTTAGATAGRRQQDTVLRTIPGERFTPYTLARKLAGYDEGLLDAVQLQRR